MADLIYGDPPFNSNRNYGAPTSKAQETDTGSMDAFVDMWTYDDKAIARTKRICKSVAHPASKLIQSLKDWLEEEDDGMLAYLSYMADRLWKLHGMLKQTGAFICTATTPLTTTCDCLWTPCLAKKTSAMKLCGNIELAESQRSGLRENTIPFSSIPKHRQQTKQFK